MLGSESTYFHQSAQQLKYCRKELIMYLKTQRYTLVKRNVYLRAFDYFCENPNDFDGATIVKDLCHIPGLDINAMLHDYHSVFFNTAASFKYKAKADWLYAKEMLATGKGFMSWLNFSLLKTVGGLHVAYAYSKRGEINKYQIKRFLYDYNTLMSR